MKLTRVEAAPGPRGERAGSMRVVGMGVRSHIPTSEGEPLRAPAGGCQQENKPRVARAHLSEVEAIFLLTFPNVETLANDSKNCKTSRANQNRSEGQILASVCWSADLRGPALSAGAHPAGRGARGLRTHSPTPLHRQSTARHWQTSF